MQIPGQQIVDCRRQIVVDGKGLEFGMASEHARSLPGTYQHRPGANRECRVEVAFAVADARYPVQSPSKATADRL